MQTTPLGCHPTPSAAALDQLATPACSTPTHPQPRVPRSTPHDLPCPWPTYASWQDWTEAEFAAVRYFARIGTDRRSHAEQDAAIGDYISWRNQRAKPKSGFATGSKIRHPDYPFKAA